MLISDINMSRTFSPVLGFVSLHFSDGPCVSQCTLFLSRATTKNSHHIQLTQCCIATWKQNIGKILSAVFKPNEKCRWGNKRRLQKTHTKTGDILFSSLKRHKYNIPYCVRSIEMVAASNYCLCFFHFVLFYSSICYQFGFSKICVHLLLAVIRDHKISLSYTKIVFRESHRFLHFSANLNDHKTNIVEQNYNSSKKKTVWIKKPIKHVKFILNTS